MSGRNAVFPFLYFAPLREGARVLVVTDQPDPSDACGLLPIELVFVTPDTADLPHGFDALAVDVEGIDPVPLAARFADSVAEEAPILLLDRRRSGLRALRDAFSNLRPGAAPRGAMRRLAAARGCQAAWQFLLEPDLDQPRHLVRPGFAGPLPAEYGSGLRRALKRWGLFYLQPRQRADILAPTGAQSTVAAVLKELFPETSAGAAVRGLYLSPTGVLILDASAGGRRAFVRFPFHEAMVERLRTSHEMTTLVRKHGFRFAPEPLRMSEGGFAPYQIEGAAEGRPATRPPGEAIAASLRVLARLHLADAQRVEMDDALFAQRLAPRLDAIAGQLGESAGLDEVRRRLHAGLLGKTVLLAISHGDFKVGNCLFGRDGEVSGVVDWDLGAACDLNLLDLANLHGRSVRDATGLSYGEIAADPERAASAFGAAYRGYFEATSTSPIEPAVLLLLWWVDRVERQLRLVGDPDGSWTRRNALGPV